MLFIYMLRECDFMYINIYIIIKMCNSNNWGSEKERARAREKEKRKSDTEYMYK